MKIMLTYSESVTRMLKFIIKITLNVLYYLTDTKIVKKKKKY